MKLEDALRKDIDPRLLQTSEGRKVLTKHDPLLFAAIYMPHKLREHENDTISLNDFHLDVIDYAKSWTKPLDLKSPHHDCFIAPRMTGKSTWIFHILPIWAGAHYHKRYIIAFSDSDTQAKGWLLNFKQEVMTNEYLKEDFPEFVDVLRFSERSKAAEDNANRTQRGNGFVFQVAGADSGVLGANVNGMRPEVILFDDIEPDASKYSTSEATKRLNTVLTSHWYLNTAAIKAFVGTTTMPNSIIDQIRKVGEAKKELEAELGDDYSREALREYVESDFRWVVDKNINCHYWPAIVTDEEGNEGSLWPEKWDYETYLNPSRHTRDFLMNMMNRPVGIETGFWEEDQIIYKELAESEYLRTIISVDPAVKTKRTNDYTGIVVASRGSDDKIYIRHAEGTRKNSEELRDYVDELIDRYGAKVLYIETNQGGDLWKQVFSGIKAKFRSVHQRLSKELRAGQAHDYYVKGYVRHAAHFATLEEQMLAFPKVPHDDVLDAMVSAVLYFKKPSQKVTVSQTNYLEGF